jgi:glycosyltransferase involved in cell wall biosynthesis
MPTINLAELTQKRALVFVIGSAEMGGAEKQLVRLARELTSRGVHVEIIFTQSGGPLTDELDRYSISWKIFALRIRHQQLRTVVGAIRLARYLSKRKPLVVNAWLPESVVIGLVFAQIFSPKSLRISSVRGNSQSHSALFRFILRMAYRSSSKVLFNGRHLARISIGKYGLKQSQVEIICNGVDIPRDISDVTVQPPTAVVVANFHNYKGHRLLLDALTKVQTPIKVRLCGSGGIKSQIAALVDKKNLSSIVTLVDEPADVAVELSAAQFAIHPSLTEGLSNAILEELAAGLPVVALDIKANAQVITDGEEGLLVKAEDVDALASAIDLLARDVRLRSRLSAKARDRALDFGWGSNVRDYENVILSLVSERSRSDFRF